MKQITVADDELHSTFKKTCIDQKVSMRKAVKEALWDWIAKVKGKVKM